MSKIRSKNTKLETSFCKLLSAKIYPLGFRYRRNYKKLLGKPDIVFVKQRIAIFLDGSFWHGYGFKKETSKLPKKYWVEKIEGNIARDKKVNRYLRKNGWTVLRLWEHTIRKNPVQPIHKTLLLLKEKNNAEAPYSSRKIS